MWGVRYIFELSKIRVKKCIRIFGWVQKTNVKNYRRITKRRKRIEKTCKNISIEIFGRNSNLGINTIIENVIIW